MATHRGEPGACAAGGLQCRFQPRGGWGVHGGQHRGGQQGRHSDRQVVQAVVVDDVETVFGIGKLHHQTEVGVVIGHEGCRHHRRIRLRRRRKRQLPYIERGAVDACVTSGSSEQRHMVSQLGQRARQMPDVGLQAAGERLAQGIPIGGYERHPQWGDHASAFSYRARCACASWMRSVRRCPQPALGAPVPPLHES
ncbi:MAG: hypothetical protein JWR34_6034 [Mycobacterium sp.]|nr:hypothetical protein [Mycobacterium sp.]